jgi:glycogen debranching enzyme
MKKVVRLFLCTVFAAVLTTTAALPCFGQDLQADAEQFEKLLDQLRSEPDFNRRGGDGPVGEQPGIGERVVRLVGRPDTYDPGGTKKLRDTVIKRWRKRFRAEGQDFLQGLQGLKGQKPGYAVEGRQDAELGRIQLSRDMSDMGTMFFLPGRTIYELGTMDGDFPPIGRLLGDQGGIWAHPVKVLDGFSFTVREEGREDWTLTDSRHFSHRFYDAEFHYERSDLAAVRHDFTAEEESVLYTMLTLRNKTDVARTVNLEFAAGVNIRPAWRSGLPNDIDEINITKGAVVAYDRENELGRVVFGADRNPDSHDVEDNIVTLTYSIYLPAGGETAIIFAIVAGPSEEKTVDREPLNRALGLRKQLLANKSEAYAQSAFEGVRFSFSDTRITEAFQLAKVNLHMLTADLRPHMPAPFFYAGIPYYTQLFGCDNTISLPGAVAAGFRETARGTLESLADNAVKQNGRSPHEVATSNRHVGDGNAQEPPQFVVACMQYFRWTGDMEFLQEMYPVCEQVIEYCRGKRDDDGYISGPALIESHGMGSQKLDAACYLYAAYMAIADMASELDRDEEMIQYLKYAEEIRSRFDNDWWMPEHSIWADSRVPGGEKRMTDYWSVVFPLLVGLAGPERIQPALTEIERGWINQWGGVHTRQPDISGQGSGIVTSNLFAMAAFSYGRADLGWELVRQASRAPYEERMLGGFVEVIPPGGSDILQLWSAAPLLGAVIEGMAGIRPDAAGHRVELSPQIPSALDSFSIEDVPVGDHLMSMIFRRSGESKNINVVHNSGPASLDCTFRIPVLPGESVYVENRKLNVRVSTSPATKQNEAFFKFALKPGANVLVSVRPE